MLADIAQFEQEESRVVVTPSGPGLSGPEMAHLAATLSQRIGNHQAPCIVLEMSKIEYIDSSALGALVIFLRDLEHASGRIVLARCNRNIVSLFKLTRLDTIIPLFDEVEFARFRDGFRPAIEGAVTFDSLTDPAGTFEKLPDGPT